VAKALRCLAADLGTPFRYPQSKRGMNHHHHSSAIARWRRDPIAFIEHCLVDPETNAAFVLYAEQKTFLRHAFERTPAGYMRYTELVFSAGKKVARVP
jgi:hypothetical protein